MKRCQEDSYLQTDVGTVVACEATTSGFRVQLKNSIFYPEGGGQPPDHGFIGSVRVNDVQEIDTIVWHSVEAELAVGEYVQRVDWKRRFDHMQQHTGQHVLTAVILERYGWPTVGFHLGEEVSYIDLDTPELTAEDLLLIEEDVTSWIRKSPTVRSTIITTDEYYSSSSIRSRGLPKGYQGAVRLIDIDGLDCNTCGGTHVANLAELQCIKLLRMEKVKRRVRLYFVFGGRVQQVLQSCLYRERQLTSVFNQGPKEHVQIATKWQAERKETGRQVKRLQQELAAYIGKDLIGQESSTLHRPDADMGILKIIAKTANAIDGQSCFALTGDGVFIVQSPKVHENKEKILSVLQGRGGGKPPILQGKCSSPEKVEDLKEFL